MPSLDEMVDVISLKGHNYSRFLMRLSSGSVKLCVFGADVGREGQDAKFYFLERLLVLLVSVYRELHHLEPKVRLE